LGAELPLQRLLHVHIALVQVLLADLKVQTDFLHVAHARAGRFVFEHSVQCLGMDLRPHFRRKDAAGFERLDADLAAIISLFHAEDFGPVVAHRDERLEKVAEVVERASDGRFAVGQDVLVLLLRGVEAAEVPLLAAKALALQEHFAIVVDAAGLTRDQIGVFAKLVGKEELDVDLWRDVVFSGRGNLGSDFVQYMRGHDFIVVAEKAGVNGRHIYHK